jgi:hypothetical protein
VATDGVIRTLVATWGTDASAWTYSLQYSDLGSTAPIQTPEKAKSLRELRRLTPEAGEASGASRD